MKKGNVLILAIAATALLGKRLAVREKDRRA